MTLDQMELLYLNFLMTPSDNEYKKLYRDGIKKEEISDSDLKEMNYSDEEIKRINEAIESL